MNILSKLHDNKNLQLAIWPQYVLGDLGDFAVAAIVAKLAFKHLGLQRKQIVLVSNKPEGFDLCNPYRFKIIQPKEVEESNEIAAVILAPITNSYEESPFTTKPALAITEGQFFKELSPKLSWIERRAFGFGDKAIGLTLDPDLESLLSLPPESRLATLQILPPCLQEVVLDRGQNRKLYIGYCKESVLKKAFVQAIKDLSVKTHSKAVIVLLGKDADSLRLGADIELIRYDMQQQTCTVVHKPIEDAVVRVVAGKLPHLHLFPLLANAEKETVITGESSVTQALQCNMKFVYEMFPSKYAFGLEIEKYVGKKVAFVTSYIQHAVPEDLASLFLEIWDSYPSYSIASLDAWPAIHLGLLKLNAGNACEIAKNVEEIPFDRGVFVSGDIIEALDLDHGKSLAYPHSTFEIERVADNFFWVKRT